MPEDRSTPLPTGLGRSRPHGAGSYDRQRDLPRLIPVWPAEISDCSPAAHRRLVAKLERALRVERRRGQAGHWAYDLARHCQLHEAYRCEEIALRRICRTVECKKKGPPRRPGAGPRMP